MKCSRTTQEHTNQPTVQTTAWTTTLECEVLLLSCSARRADAMETARFGQPRCDWLWRGGEDRIFTAWRLCWQKKIKKREKTDFFSSKKKVDYLSSGLCFSLEWHIDIMPKTFSKVHKKISKKRGAVEALHENSRDAKRLNRANTRDTRVARVQANMSRGRQSYCMSLLVCVILCVDGD